MFQILIGDLRLETKQYVIKLNLYLSILLSYRLYRFYNTFDCEFFITYLNFHVRLMLVLEIIIFSPYHGTYP